MLDILDADVNLSWRESLESALESLNREYLKFLRENRGYIPKREMIFNAFKTLSKDKVKYILFGQDPYPRESSATGYAFIDGRVKTIFGDRGLSKEVNRATSLRNFIKMALVAEDRLNCNDLSQKAISQIDRRGLIDSMDDLRLNFEKEGVLLLNSSLIFTDRQESKKHIKEWRGFMQTLLNSFKERRPTLILFGNFSKEMKKRFDLESFETVELEHPFNHSFICNRKSINTFRDMKLLRLRDR